MSPEGLIHAGAVFVGCGEQTPQQQQPSRHHRGSEIKPALSRRYARGRCVGQHPRRAVVGAQPGVVGRAYLNLAAADQ